MYCKLYIHAPSPEAVSQLLEKHFGKAKHIRRDCFFKDFEIMLKRNEEADSKKMSLPSEGFLYYEIIAEAEFYREHIKLTDSILRVLGENGMPATAACDYEQELEEQNITSVRRSVWNIP